MAQATKSPEGEFQMAEMTRQRGRQDRQVAILKPGTRNLENPRKAPVLS